MSSHQASSKPRSSKCRHFCFPFDLHNYCRTCRESGKGDDPCVTNLSPCNICANFTEEQQTEIKHRRQYTRKQKSSDVNTSKDDLDLLGDNEESFTGNQADLEGAAENLFSSPPRPQPLHFESLSLNSPPHNVPPTSGTALQNKIESRLVKSLGSSLNIQLKQEMGVFQASILEAMKSLRDEMLSFQKASKSGLVKTFDSAKQNLCLELLLNPTLRLGLLIFLHPNTRMFNLWTWSPMDLHFLPSLLNLSPSMLPNTRMLNPSTRNIVPIRSTTRYFLNIRSILIRGNTNLNPAIFLSRRQRKMSPLPLSKSLQNLSLRFLQNLSLRTAQIQCFIGR